MLQSMRHLAQSFVFKGLMLILVISFGIWGVGDIFRGNPLQRKVAKVGDKVITVQELDSVFQKKLADFRQKIGGDVTAQMAKQLGLLDDVLEQMIDRAELEQEIGRLGLVSSDKTALDWLLSQPNLHNPDGSFNREAFQYMMEKARMDEARFITEEKKALAGREFARVMEINGKAPSSVIDPLAAARGQKRIFDIVTIVNSGISDVGVPDDKSLHEFYDAHPQIFTAPEYRSLTIARLSVADLEKDIAITDDQLKKEYDARISQYTHPERRDVLQVVTQDEARARQLVSTARASGNLANAAEGMGYKTVGLNGTEEKTALPELAKPIFALMAGQVSDPVKSPLGWHVLQLKKISPAGTSSFAEVRDQLRETMQRDQSVDNATRMVNQMDDELAAGHSLEDIADSLKLRLIKISALDAQGKMPDGKEPVELPSKDDVLKAAFGQNASEVSPIMDDKDGHYVIVRTDEVTPSAVQPFDKVKDKIVAAWKTQEQAKHASTEAGNVAKALRDGKAPSSFAAQTGMDVRVSKPVSLLGDKDPALPENVLPQIMHLKKGEVTIVPLQDKQLVLRLAEIVDMGQAEMKTAQPKLGTEIDHDLSNELSDQYLSYLKKIHPVSVNRDVLDTMEQSSSQQGG